MERETLIVIGISTRALASAGRRSGFQLHAIDGFADVDQQHTTLSCQRVALTDQGLDPDELEIALNLCDPTARHAVIVASGLDGQSEVIAQLGKRRECLCANAQIFQKVYSPARFFALLTQLKIDFPATFIHSDKSGTTLPGPHSPPLQSNTQWLSKVAAGCGGLHIQAWEPDAPLHALRYRQAHVNGMSLSVTVLATRDGVDIVGYADQTPEDSPGNTPFAFSQAISMVADDLPAAIVHSVDVTVAKLCKSLGLRGLCSFDFIIDEHKAWLLEVNPRPSAVFELHDHQGQLVGNHVRALRDLPTQARPLNEPHPATGFRILYSPRSVTIAASSTWPDWVSDRPHPGQTIGENTPLCTVHAESSSTRAVRILLKERATRILTSALFDDG